MAPRGITAQGILNGFFTTGRRGNSLGLGSTKLNINSGNRSAGSDAVALNLSKQEDNSTGPIASQAALSGDIRKNSLKAIRDLADQAANLSKRLATLQGGSQSDEIENELAAIANEIRNLTGYGEDINGLYAARDDASQDADNADAAVIVNQNGITSLQLQNSSLEQSGVSLDNAVESLDQTALEIESRLTNTSAGTTSVAVAYSDTTEIAITSVETTSNQVAVTTTATFDTSTAIEEPVSYGSAVETYGSTTGSSEYSFEVIDTATSFQSLASTSYTTGYDVEVSSHTEIETYYLVTNSTTYSSTSYDTNYYTETGSEYITTNTYDYANTHFSTYDSTVETYEVTTNFQTYTDTVAATSTDYVVTTIQNTTEGVVSSETTGVSDYIAGTDTQAVTNTSYDDTSTVFYAEDPETLLASSSNLNVDYQNVIAAGEANSLAIQYNSQAVIAKGDQIVSLSSLADAKRDESAYYQDLIDNFQGDSAEPAPGLTAGEFAALSYRPSEEEVEAVEVLASSLSKATDTKVAGTEFTEKVRADSVKIDQQILNERDATALASDVAGRIVKDPKIGLQAVLNNLDPAKLDVASLLTDTILDGSSSVGIRRR